MYERLPRNTTVFNKHQPLLGHLETEISHTEVKPYVFRTYQIYNNTQAVRVQNCSQTSRYVLAVMENGAGYELKMYKTPGATGEVVQGFNEMKGVEYEIGSNMEAEFWVKYKYNEQNEGKVMEISIEMMPEAQELGRRFYFLYLRGKHKKLKKVGEKFVQSCDEFWEREAGFDQEALKRRILFMRATPLED